MAEKLVQFARRYATLGYKVFPVDPGSKRPHRAMAPHGVNDASDDPETLNRWFRRDENIGLACTGLLVIDVDVGHDWAGVARLEASGCPVQNTPSGGKHFLFRRPSGKTWGNSAGKLAHKIDTRTDGGYIVVEPSKTSNGAYSFVNALLPRHELPSVPQWLAEELDRAFAPTKTTPFVAPVVSANGGAEIVSRAISYLKACPPAVAGQGGHNQTFGVAQAIVNGFRLAPEQAFRLLAEHYNPRCDPPWIEKELRHKINDAVKNPCDKPSGWLLDDKPIRSGQPMKRITANPPDRPTADGTREELERLAEPWPEIVSFDVPEFPARVLPAVLRDWVEAESHATQTPADLAGLLALSVCSACIARRVVVEPRSGWREPVNLFAAVLLESGNRKSAVFTDAMEPLRELETERIEEERPAVAREQSERRQDEKRLQKLEKKAGETGDAEARQEACDLAVEMDNNPPAVLPRLIVDDATSEKLAMMLQDQGGRIASMSPEGGVFDLMAGLYSKSGIPQFGVYLMGHSGDDLITDRVGRKSVRVERPALTCAYAMQPAVIEGLAENAAFRGRGLLARFLYAMPRSRIGERVIAPHPVSDEIRNAYHEVVRTLGGIKG